MKVNSTSFNESGALVTVTVPPFQVGVFSYGISMGSGDSTTTRRMAGVLTSVDQSNVEPGNTTSHVYAYIKLSASTTAQGTSDKSTVYKKVDSSSQIRHREYGFGDTFGITGTFLATQGYQMDYTVTDLV